MQQRAPTRPSGSRHADILDWFRTTLPDQSEENDALIYHTPVPLHRPYEPHRLSASKAILSLTPTEGIYGELQQSPKERKFLFLHRPWGLDRKRVPHGTLVIQSHVRFDELYTTGYNTAFAARHAVDPSTIVCLQGYKNDPSRRIGLLGKLKTKRLSREFLNTLIDDFGGFEAQQGTEEPAAEIHAIASLNAFNEEIVERVRSALPDVACENILCVTGAARELGLVAAGQCGLQVLCVGHRRSEMWGINYLANKMGAELKLSKVQIVDEPDFVPERKIKGPTLQATPSGQAETTAQVSAS